jgi:hypothetical protein
MISEYPNATASAGRGTRPIKHLVPEYVAHEDGVGPVIDVGTDRGKLLVLTLAITCAIERATLIVYVSGSTDKTNWDNQLLVSFTRKEHLGVYSILLNLAKYPAVKYIRVEWKLSRWRRGDPSPVFGFSVTAEESGSRISVSAA